MPYNDDASDMAKSTRGLAAFLFFLALSSQAGARQEVFFVSNAGFSEDGPYVEEGQGSVVHYARCKWLGGGLADSYGWYLYRGTELRETWVLGSGRNFETREAFYRAPAGSASGLPPPEKGWEYVHDGSKDGGESGEDWELAQGRTGMHMRVTGPFQLDEKETAAGVCERGGGQTVEGIICRVDGKGVFIVYRLSGG